MAQELLRRSDCERRDRRGTWKTPLNLGSNYAAEAESVADDGAKWLNAHKPKKGEKKAIVLDVDDTTLTTWNYELYSNWIFDPVTNGNFVGLTGSPGAVHREHVPGHARDGRPRHGGQGHGVCRLLPHGPGRRRSTRPPSPTS